MSASYSYICAAVAASLRIGLHMSVASQGLDSIERETRTRTFSVLNIMETYVTTALGLPKTLRDVNSDQLLPSDVDSTTSKSPFSSPIDDPTSPTAVTQAHARLIMIMAKAVQSIHPTNRPDYRQNGFYGVKYFHITEAEAELETWFRQLPQVPNVDQAEDGTIVRSQLLLRLAYGHVQMILYRPFLHHVVRDVPGSVFHFRSYACGSACVKAAMQVIWIAEALDVRGFLSEAYWFTVLILSAATTSLLVFILGNKGDPTIKETVQAVTRAKNILARLAARSPTARRCLASLK
ncbi:Gypsy retrotransposon integrase-like protein 1, partial [Cryomyces antarcticus]